MQSEQAAGEDLGVEKYTVVVIAIGRNTTSLIQIIGTLKFNTEPFLLY